MCSNDRVGQVDMSSSLVESFSHSHSPCTSSIYDLYGSSISQSVVVIIKDSNENEIEN